MKKEKESKAQPEKDYAGVEAKLKKEHGEITKIEFKVKDKVLTAYLRQPTLAELDATISGLATAPISSSVGMFRTVFVAGDDELIEMASQTGIAIAINKEIQKIIPLVMTTSQTL